MINFTEKLINLKIKKKEIQNKILEAKDKEELESLVEQYKELSENVNLTRSAIEADQADTEIVDSEQPSKKSKQEDLVEENSQAEKLSFVDLQKQIDQINESIKNKKSKEESSDELKITNKLQNRIDELEETLEDEKKVRNKFSDQNENLKLRLSATQKLLKNAQIKEKKMVDSKKYNSLKDKFEALTSTNKKLQKEINLNKTRNIENEKKIFVLSNNFDSAMNELSLHKAKFADSQTQLESSIKENQQLKNELDSCKSENSTITEENVQIILEKEKIIDDIKNEKQQIEFSLREKNDELYDDIEKLNKKISQNEDDVLALKNQISEKDQVISEIKESNAQKDEQIKLLKAKLSEVDSLYIKRSESVETSVYNDLQDEYASLLNEYEVLGNKYEYLDSSFNDLQEELKNQKVLLSQANENKSNMVSQETVLQLQEKISELENEKQINEQELIKNRVTATELENAKEEIRKLSDELEDMVSVDKYDEVCNDLAELKTQLEILNEEKNRALNSKYVGMSKEELEQRIEVLRERLKSNDRELKYAKKEYIPLFKIKKTLDNDKKKLRRKEAIVAKNKVVLYGVNNISDIDQDKAQKLQEDLDLLDGLRLSVQHCEDVMNVNKDRMPLLEKNYNILKNESDTIRADILSCEEAIKSLTNKQ